MKLNHAQQEAVDTLEGPVLVIAGAGTGKTQTLVHRLVNLTRSGVAPESILLLTFTRRAAEEMVARASRLAGDDGQRVSGGTYHSFAHACLRRHGRVVDVPTDFTILDQSDTFEIVGGIRSELKQTEPGLDLPRRETMAGIISKAVNKQALIEDVVSDEYPQFFAISEFLDVAAARYETYKKERNLVDFDNLLVLLARMLEESDETRARVQERCRYVMVDEYQDTNVLQARITNLLSGDTENIMVVGDDAQSIYGFRGARHRNLFEFHERFPHAHVVTLETNYRSTQPILDVANALMVQMTSAFRKHLVTEASSSESVLPLVVEANDEQEQARFVACEIERLQGDGVASDEIAVLFRASRHAFPLEVELTQRNIGFVKYGGFKFAESAHIKDVLAHVRLVAHPEDDFSLHRVLLMRDGIGKQGARRIAESVGGEPVVAALRRQKLSGKAAASVQELADLIEGASEYRSQPSRCLQSVVADYSTILEKRFDDWPRRKRDLESLVDLVERYDDLESMLSELTLDPPSVSKRGVLAGPEKDGLVLSTIHSAKGLEWKAVFVIQARDGFIPMVAPGADEEDPDALDEELRLLYVAISRAKRSLYLVWPREIVRARYQWPMVSRFVSRVPPEYLECYEAGDLLA